MDHLLRELAPISILGWQEIEKEATRTLKTTLAARRLVDFAGPRGWSSSAVSLGRSKPITSPAKGRGIVCARMREVLPLIELRVPFEMRRTEIENAERGAMDIDTEAVIAAARAIAIAEDHAVFHGYDAAGIRGICGEQSGHAVPIVPDYDRFPDAVTAALDQLRDQGVNGPYAIALGEECYRGVTKATRGGYPVLNHVRQLVEGPLVWTPGLEGAAVLSRRGGDFQLTIGEDFSIGYLSHDADVVRLYIEESFTFWLLSAQAAVPLIHRDAAEVEHPQRQAAE